MASLVAQTVKSLPTMLEAQVQYQGWGDLEKGMATHSSSVSWRISWSAEPARPQSTGSWRVRHDWAEQLILSLISIKICFCLQVAAKCYLKSLSIFSIRDLASLTLSSMRTGIEDWDMSILICSHILNTRLHAWHRHSIMIQAIMSIFIMFCLLFQFHSNRFLKQILII